MFKTSSIPAALFVLSFAVTTSASGEQKNILGGSLRVCSMNPLTGWTRNGYCENYKLDRGVHSVCGQMTEQFLIFTRAMGNDLSTPSPQYGFPGLKPGDRWCLCAVRWQQAYEAGKAPFVVIYATHEVGGKFAEKEDLVKMDIMNASDKDSNLHDVPRDEF